jgi:multiple sugar transport system substrate-binding protein
MARTLTRGMALALCVLLGGCRQEQATPAVAAGLTEVTLQLFGDPAEVEGYRQLIAAFESANADVRVRLVPVGKQRDHMAKLTTAFAGGTPPDLFLLNYRRYGQFADKGVLEPLGTRLARSGVLKESELYAPAVEAFRSGGELLCLPQNISSLVVYYNRGLFERFGVAQPRPGWKWEDFKLTAKGLTRDTDGDGRNDIHGLGLEPSLARLAPFIWQAGGEVVDNPRRPRRLDLLGSGSQEALLLLLQRVHRVVPTLEEVKSEGLEARFAAGRLGMLLHSRRLVATLRTVPGLDWDVAPLPEHHRAATVLHADAYCMSRSSRVKEAAFRFVEFALGPVGAALVAGTGRSVPSLRSVAESPAFLAPGQRPASARVFLESIAHLRRLPNLSVWNEVETRADPIVEEWYYSEPPEGTQLREAPTGAGVQGSTGGSMRHLLKLRTEVNALGYELNEATQGLFAPAKGGP